MELEWQSVLRTWQSKMEEEQALPGLEGRHSEGGARVRETEWLWRKVPCEPVNVASWGPPEEWSYQLELVDLSGRLAADVVASCHGTVRSLSAC